MVTDDERREVAERLRMSDERDAAGFDCLLAEVVRGSEFCETPCEECHRRLAAEMADLIEPNPERTGYIEYKGQTESDPVGYAVCSECGDTLEACDNASYCPWCGVRLVDDVEA